MSGYQPRFNPGLALTLLGGWLRAMSEQSNLV